MSLSATILFATYNRASVLRKTLEALCAVDRRDLDVRIVVADNNSSDATHETVRAFEGRLPLTYLFEPRPGKNCALNLALNTVALGEWVIFTDDDVTPRADWLREVQAATARWPSTNVFGGKILVEWPMFPPPSWASKRWILEFGFSQHDLGEEEMWYPPGVLPFGPNYWMRSALFGSGLRFNEAVGPRPTNRIMGSETTLLSTVANSGERMVYAPGATVRHRISEAGCRLPEICRRAYRYGRSLVHLRGLPRMELFRRSPRFWQIRILLDYLGSVADVAVAALLWVVSRRPDRLFSRLMLLGNHHEALSVRGDWDDAGGVPVTSPRGNVRSANRQLR